MLILGISCFYHDSAAVLISDQIIVAAAQEERFSRIKHDANFPKKAIIWCLQEAAITLSEVDCVVFYDKPLLTFDRLTETYLTFAPRGFISFLKAIPVWLKDKLFQKSNLITKLQEIDEKFDKKKLLFSEHHLSHASSAYYGSPFNEAVVITIDGVGEWATTTIAVGKNEKLEIKEEIHFPHSLGLLYSAITYHLGFKVNSGEYKVMGLAPYGEPIYKDLLMTKVILVKDDGSFYLNQSYFDYCTGLKMTNKKFSKLLDLPVRKEGEKLLKAHLDLAASVQSVIEEVIFKIANYARDKYKIKNLCLAGGVALNCVANGKLFKERIFNELWIQPASGDAGGALGAAWLAYFIHYKKRRDVVHSDLMQGGYLGPSFTDEEVEAQLKLSGATYEKLNFENLLTKVCEEIANNNVVGWFQGKMEFGPRSLGNRSIIGNPMSKSSQKNINLKIKFRESFRPFAPAVLKEDATEWFELGPGVESPYMLLVADVTHEKRLTLDKLEIASQGLDKLNISRSKIPAVTHVDYSARIQTVSADTNPRFYKLLNTFKEKTGCGVLVNTSFNVRGEPIVCDPADAFRCFMGTDMDILVIGNYYMEKKKQNKSLKVDYKHQFELD